MKKEKTQLKTKKLKQNIFKSVWICGFSETDKRFYKSCNEIGQKHFGSFLKNIVFCNTGFSMQITRSLN